MKRPTIISITGGIGSGKSVVSKILLTLGYSVYDCDSRAKSLMDNSDEIKAEIAQQISSEVVKDGSINRPLLASIVFADKQKLSRLNSIVHTHVKRDLTAWAERKADAKIVFVETAILYGSGLHQVVDCDWRVIAPEEVRIARVIDRNKATREQVKQRIASQAQEESYRHISTLQIVNDNETPLLPQILELVNKHAHED
jgi:dephospho-CoA kinase